MSDLMTPQLKQRADERSIMLLLKVDQYHRMIDSGILPEGEPFELLNGQLVRKDRSEGMEDPMTVGHGHVLVVKRLAKLSPAFERLGCHMQTQQPVSLPPYDEPEPDGAVVLGSEEDYRDRLPGAAEIMCVIEVADSSLHRDRTTKLEIYAAAGISRYIIINLVDRTIEVHSQPLSGKGRAARYGKLETLTRGQSVEIPGAEGKSLSVAVDTLLS